MNIVQVEGAPFFLKRGKTGCILIHGFTGAPKEMRWLGDQLADEDFSVLGIRLSGHGTDQNDLLRARWQDWFLSVEDGYHLLRGYCEKVILVGLSLGGILSFLFSSKFPIHGVVSYSTAIDIPIERIRPFVPLLPLISKFWKFAPKDEPDWTDKNLAEGHFEYPSYPIRAVYELHLLLTEMRSHLSDVKAPVLLVHSKADQSVPPKHSQMIYENLGTEDKEIVWLEKSGHVVTGDLEKEKVLQATLKFIRRLSIS
jgi:carboxylesterase